MVGLRTFFFLRFPFVSLSEPQVLCGSAYLGSRLRCRHVVVVRLLEQMSLDLGMLEQLKVALCKALVSRVSLHHDGSLSCRQIPNPSTGSSREITDIAKVLLRRLTSQMPTLLQVVDSLPPVALAHLFPD